MSQIQENEPALRVVITILIAKAMRQLVIGNPHHWASGFALSNETWQNAVILVCPSLRR